MGQLGGGARISEEFQYIDPKPLASASVAQVHRAKLRTGEEVVLKVWYVAVLWYTCYAVDWLVQHEQTPAYTCVGVSCFFESFVEKLEGGGRFSAPWPCYDVVKQNIYIV